MSRKLVFNFIAFHLVYFSAIFGSAYQIFWPVHLLSFLFIFLHFYFFSESRKKEALIVGGFAFSGWLLESILIYAEAYQPTSTDFLIGFQEFVVPLWLIELWLAFALLCFLWFA